MFAIDQRRNSQPDSGNLTVVGVADFLHRAGNYVENLASVLRAGFSMRSVMDSEPVVDGPGQQLCASEVDSDDAVGSHLIQPTVRCQPTQSPPSLRAR